MKTKNKLPESLNIGQWVITKDGRTIKITSDDYMPNLKYEDIERLATSDEIPEFKFEIGNDYGLNDKRFWNPLIKKLPLSSDLFFKWLTAYKKEIKWQTLRFTELPFDMQVGVIFKFIYENTEFNFYHEEYTRENMVECILFGFNEIESELKEK